MRWRIVLAAALAVILIGGSAKAWNFGPHYVNALRFDTNGEIHFTLFESGQSGAEIRCSSGSGGQWFVVSACSANNANCVSGVDRMASMLLDAKVVGKKIFVQRSNCMVTEVALKP